MPHALKQPKVVIIDNYDSFTYNLVQAFGSLGAEIKIFLHDQIQVSEIAALAPTHLCISPGPGTPADAGISKEVIQTLGSHIPLLGVCLGHQCIIEVFGGKIIRAQQILHGKTSQIYHGYHFPFNNMPNPFQAMRYHSLIAETKNLPACLLKTAWSEQQELMGVKHRELPITGVQFHPESILTPEGHLILKEFLLSPLKKGAKS